jgi:hypothetical protein
MSGFTIEKLVELRITAKKNEDDAIAHRRGIDDQIAALMRDPTKPEGTVSKNLGTRKLSVQYGITRKVNSEVLGAAWMDLPEAVQGAFKWSADVAVKNLKALDAKLTLEAAQFIESKASTPSVKLELA